MKKICFPLLLFVCGTIFAQTLEISDGICGLRYESGKLLLLDRAGEPVFRIGNYRFVWSPPVAVLTEVEKIDGKNLRLHYKTEKGDPEKVAVSAVCSLTGRGMKLSYDVRADGVKTGGCMQDIVLLNGTVKSQIRKTGYWKRPLKNGVPFEIRGHYMKQFNGKNQNFWLLKNGPVNWSGKNTEHAGLTPGKEKGRFAGELEFIAAEKNTDHHLLSASLLNRAFVLETATPREYNLWEKGSPEFTLSVREATGKDRSGTLKISVRDYDGREIFREQKSLKFKAGESRAFHYRLPPMERGIYFVEASLFSGGKEYFTRTNLAVLPPYRFRSLETSPVGMAAYPERKSAYGLMRRLGVRFLRYGNNAETLPEYGMVSFFACHAPPKIYNGAKDAKTVEKWVSAIEKQKNPVFEFGNEIGWKKSREQQEFLIRCYASWVREIRKALDDRGLKHVKLITFGIQPDYSGTIMEMMRREGVFPCMDGLTLHPGRGYYTADDRKGGWTYLGIIRKAKKLFASYGYGDREIHMTEVYACTHPNDPWKDSYRQAAENTVLSIAFAYAEKNVKTMMFYKLHQGTTADPNGYQARDNGVMPENAEYDFGLLMRDDSPKPSFLAFAAAAEALDGAGFLRELSIPGTNVQGLEFDTPRGKLAILYDRTDGTNLAKLSPRFRTPDFRHKEAWEEHWKTSAEHVFKASGADVTVIDSIGRRKTVPVRNGKVSLVMNGAPLMVYGLDLE